MNGIPPWGGSINVDDEELDEDLYGDELDNIGFDEHNGEIHVTLSKPVAYAVASLTLVGLGSISYVFGKLIERVLDK